MSGASEPRRGERRPPCRACVSGHTGPKHDAERAFDALSPEGQPALRSRGPGAPLTLDDFSHACRHGAVPKCMECLDG